LLERIGTEQADIVEEGISHAMKDTTERRALVLSRIGQGQFRESLMSLWGGRCAVTGLDIAALLRASHIKPWRDSDNRERLDPYNGLLLSPSYDATFDAGLITFGDDGRVILSAVLTPSRIESLGLKPAGQITGLQVEHRAYLGHHRQNVFVG
jgi:predicted restriction endonuclease